MLQNTKFSNDKSERIPSPIYQGAFEFLCKNFYLVYKKYLLQMKYAMSYCQYMIFIYDNSSTLKDIHFSFWFQYGCLSKINKIFKSYVILQGNTNFKITYYILNDNFTIKYNMCSKFTSFQFQKSLYGPSLSRHDCRKNVRCIELLLW